MAFSIGGSSSKANEDDASSVDSVAFRGLTDSLVSHGSDDLLQRIEDDHSKEAGCSGENVDSEEAYDKLPEAQRSLVNACDAGHTLSKANKNGMLLQVGNFLSKILFTILESIKIWLKERFFFFLATRKVCF